MTANNHLLSMAWGLERTQIFYERISSLSNILLEVNVQTHKRTQWAHSWTVPSGCPPCAKRPRVTLDDRLCVRFIHFWRVVDLSRRPTPGHKKKIEGRPKRAQAPPSASAVERSRRLVTGDGFGSPPAPPPRGHGLRPRPREPAPPHLLHRRAGVAVACGTGGRAHDGGLRPSRYSEPSVILCTCSSILCGMAPKGDFCSFGNLEVFQLTEINFRFVSHGSVCLSYWFPC
jgi:hypothetical protein